MGKLIGCCWLVTLFEKLHRKMMQLIPFLINSCNEYSDELENCSHNTAASLNKKLIGVGKIIANQFELFNSKFSQRGM
jgi:hypothetical protein